MFYIFDILSNLIFSPAEQPISYSEYRSNKNKYPVQLNKIYPIQEQGRGGFHCAFISAFLIIVNSDHLKRLLMSTEAPPILAPLQQLCRDYEEGYIIDPFDIRKAWAQINIQTTLRNGQTLEMFFQTSIDGYYTNANSLHDPDELIKQLLLNHIPDKNPNIPQRTIKKLFERIDNQTSIIPKNLSKSEIEKTYSILGTDLCKEVSESGHVIGITLVPDNSNFIDLFNKKHHQINTEAESCWYLTDNHSKELHAFKCREERIKYPNTPNFLVININRYNLANPNHPNFQKIKNIPMELVIPQELITTPLPETDRTLVLRGCSIAQPGHHYSCIKTQEGWYDCNNLNNGGVRKINEFVLQSILNGEQDQTASYIHYYERKQAPVPRTGSPSSKKPYFMQQQSAHKGDENEMDDLKQMEQPGQAPKLIYDSPPNSDSRSSSPSNQPPSDQHAIVLSSPPKKNQQNTYTLTKPLEECVVRFDTPLKALRQSVNTGQNSEQTPKLLKQDPVDNRIRPPKDKRIISTSPLTMSRLSAVEKNKSTPTPIPQIAEQRPPAVPRVRSMQEALQQCIIQPNPNAPAPAPLGRLQALKKAPPKP